MKQSQCNYFQVYGAYSVFLTPWTKGRECQSGCLARILPSCYSDYYQIENRKIPGVIPGIEGGLYIYICQLIDSLSERCTEGCPVLKIPYINLFIFQLPLDQEHLLKAFLLQLSSSKIGQMIFLTARILMIVSNSTFAFTSNSFPSRKRFSK